MPELPVLQLGSTGYYVQLLQRNLIGLAYNFNNLTVDGAFGPKTQQSVISLQGDYKLPQNGIVGPSTWKVMTDNVIAVQKLLNSRGYNSGNPDGWYGQATTNAAMQFQKANGLYPEGVINPRTRRKLFNPNPKDNYEYRATSYYISSLNPNVAQQAINFLNLTRANNLDVRTTVVFRSWDEQDRLYAQGRTVPGSVITNTRGGGTYHNWGLAFDAVPFENGAISNDISKYRLMGSLGEQVGLEWGGTFTNNPDYKHFQNTFGLSVIDLLNGVIPPAVVPPPDPPVPPPSGSQYYVSTTGNDSNNGRSIGAAFRTVQKGLDSVRAGDTLNIIAGTYAEQVVVRNSGTAGNYITIRNNGTDVAKISVARLSNENPLMYVHNINYVKIQGLELGNASGTRVNCIYVDGNSNGLQIINCKIHDMHASSQGHGILIRGTDSSTPIQNLLIDGNEIYNGILGGSESLTIAGNVIKAQITHNVVHDNDNIGIAIAGWYGNATGSADQARNSYVAFNTAYNITSAKNPAYGGNLAASGIYVDGGRDICIERNLVHDCDIGIQVACETGGHTATGCIVRNNLIYGGHFAGVILGGATTSNGTATGNYVYNNSLYNNYHGIRLQNGSGNYIFNMAMNEPHNALRVTLGSATFSNVYWTGASETTKPGMINADPKFTNPSGAILTLQPGSPARLSGQLTINSVSITSNFSTGFGDGTKDYAGKPRIVNIGGVNKVDCGAYQNP